MPWLMASVYDRVMQASEDACLRDWRAELLAGLRGRVLEVGPGTGASLACYPASVTELILAEPDPHMRARLEPLLAARLGPQVSARVIPAGVEALGLPDASVDAVVASLVLCSVPSQARALAELRRVLVPGGELVFLEHVVAHAHEHPRRHRWQHRLEPVWKRVAGNCHLTRDTEAAIREAGFEIVELHKDSMRKAIPLVRPSIRGRARKPD